MRHLGKSMLGGLHEALRAVPWLVVSTRGRVTRSFNFPFRNQFPVKFSLCCPASLVVEKFILL